MIKNAENNQKMLNKFKQSVYIYSITNKISLAMLFLYEKHTIKNEEKTQHMLNKFKTYQLTSQIRVIFESGPLLSQYRLDLCIKTSVSTYLCKIIKNANEKK